MDLVLVDNIIQDQDLVSRYRSQVKQFNAHFLINAFGIANGMHLQSKIFSRMTIITYITFSDCLSRSVRGETFCD